jgi:hypothetical protein
MGYCQNIGGCGEGRTKQVDQCAHEYRKTGTHTHRALKWTRRPRILNSSKRVISTKKKKKEKVLVLGVLSAESTGERQGRRVGMCGWDVYLSDRHIAV